VDLIHRRHKYVSLGRLSRKFKRRKKKNQLCKNSLLLYPENTPYFPKSGKTPNNNESIPNNGLKPSQGKPQLTPSM